MKERQPFREKDDLGSPTREKLGNYKYVVRDFHDKENRKSDDPYLNFVGKSYSQYDFNRLPQDDISKRPLDTSPAGKVDYKKTSYTPDALKSYGIVEETVTTFVPGDRGNGEPPLGSSNKDQYNQGRYPCKNYIMTWQQDPVDSTLQTTPYKGMNYPDMINKIREDRASESKEFAEQEKMRKKL